MAMTSGKGQRTPFFPKADAAILSSRHGPLPTYPKNVWPIYDPDNFGKPIAAWPSSAENGFYPPPKEEFAPASIPEKPAAACLSDRYLRAFLAENERLRCCMLWYYTRDLFNETEFLSGLREKTSLAQESTGWEFVVIGILDVNFYIRLASIGLPLAILPRGETICAHTVTQPPGSVFLLPNMMEDWRFRESPYVESGGLKAYAGAPLRLQNESGECVALGSLCVASRTSQEPLTRLQQQTLARLADWVVSDIVQCARARRQRDRRRMAELISAAQVESDRAVSEEPVLRILRTMYSEATVSVQPSKGDHVDIDSHGLIPVEDLEDGLWEDTDYLDDFIANSNNQDLPSTRAVRAITAPCESVSGPSFLVVASRDFRLVFDDVDSWFVQTCANMVSQIWHKRLLAEAMKAKEKFLRGFSHQLRTPIHGILGSVELLAEDLMSRTLPDLNSSSTKSGESTIYLDSIRSSGRDLMSIVNSMITLNRWADIAITNRNYATHTASELEAELESGILKATSGDTLSGASLFFGRDMPRDHDSFRIDLDLLRDSLLPLILNAIQHTSRGVVAVTVSLRPTEKELVVDVEDTGCGIDVADQQRIFEPYEKAQMHSAGAGLGLTLAAKFATLLYGSVALVSSEVGRGSHFRAIFREVECAPSPISSPEISKSLRALPSKYYNMSSQSDSVLLCDHFTRFLTSHGFTNSDSIDDEHFVVLDLEADPEKRHSQLSQIRTDRVAVCLVPFAEGESQPEETSDNIIYIGGPFSTSKMISVLEEADRRQSSLKTQREPQLDMDESLPAPPNAATGPTTNMETKTLVLLQNPVPQAGADDAPGIDGVVSSKTIKDVEIAAESAPTAPIPPALAVSKPAALLVDDNVVNLRIMQMYCKKRGLPYCCAADGKQAVEMFTKQQSLAASGDGPGVQLILMDLQMPVCDGFEATRQIRLLEKQNNWKTSVVFIVTGQDSPSDRKVADDVGADDYYVKPVGIKVLDRGVKQYFPAFEV
ncbi:hypothetical protein JDV02_009762 [Purpureocillium takamizusanense]|uniref:histidine kinase n=1 Tax=Purpureocillium takamizusanense TaxID=2060973 RepID=A0A9Q8QT48_9HYPO|nr:uncharacterized protein JDV02_009762 [Purpureocillium takamizusanense]UNI23977.1 hypothetical protein JDV02_009762 [Purpureocillium takamizusanense]